MTRKHFPGPTAQVVVVDLATLFAGRASRDALPRYLERARSMAGEGQAVVLTGRAPVWLFLAVAHDLHGVAVSLAYRSPALKGRDLVVFDHNPD